VLRWWDVSHTPFNGSGNFCTKMNFKLKTSNSVSIPSKLFIVVTSDNKFFGSLSCYPANCWLFHGHEYLQILPSQTALCSLLSIERVYGISPQKTNGWLSSPHRSFSTEQVSHFQIILQVISGLLCRDDHDKECLEVGDSKHLEEFITTHYLFFLYYYYVFLIYKQFTTYNKYLIT